ncbi:phenylacetate-CoA oxygenase/reductase subunit PaaK [Compostibacter hankyongensis]|uniref:Phenylacetate-CoA oxygenase/reductase subunit PaaK n=2 Tax=Compostibacter hankyongensis TaxID=1007089 RepID=A0ABP8FH09_9BACT
METLLSLRVKKIIRETPDAITVFLENTAGTAIDYRPGQFLTLLLNMGGRPLRRSYSLSSVAGLDPDLAITIRRIENGEVSRYLFDHLTEGDLLESLYPAGRFIPPPIDEGPRDILMVGGGSGITPLFGLLRHFLKYAPETRITLLYASHSEDRCIYFEALNALREEHAGRFSCRYFFSAPRDRQRYPPQRLHNALFEEIIRSSLHYPGEKALFYLCGPGSLMRMAQLTLLFMGFSEQQLRREIFTSPVVTTPLRHYHARAAVESLAILHQRGKTYRVAVPAGENILQAALDQGIPLPYSCRGGMCSTCVARCRSGKVHLLVNEVLTDKDLEAGLVLTCVGIPETPEVEIDFDAG